MAPTSGRSLHPNGDPAHVGHEYCGVVIEVGSEVQSIGFREKQ